MNKLFSAGMTLAFGIVIYKINAWQDRGAIGLVKYFKKRTTAAEYKLLAALNALNRKDKQIEKLIAEVGEARSVARVLWCGVFPTRVGVDLMETKTVQLTYEEVIPNMDRKMLEACLMSAIYTLATTYLARMSSQQIFEYLYGLTERIQEREP